MLLDRSTPENNEIGPLVAELILVRCIYTYFIKNCRWRITKVIGFWYPVQITEEKFLLKTKPKIGPIFVRVC